MTGVTALLYIPVTSAGVRRLHDIGETGWLMVKPLVPITSYLALLGLLIGYLSYSPGGRAFVLLGVTFFLLLPLFFGLLLALGVLGFAMLIISLFYFDQTLGLLLQPAQSGSNKYGPNPLEVPS